MTVTLARPGERNLDSGLRLLTPRTRYTTPCLETPAPVLPEAAPEIEALRSCRHLPNRDLGMDITTYFAPRNPRPDQTGTAQFVICVNRPGVEKVRLVLFGDPADRSPFRVDPPMELTGTVEGGASRYSLTLTGIRPGTLYGFELEGPGVPTDEARWYADPHSWAVVSSAWATNRAPGYTGPPLAEHFIPPKSVLIDAAPLEEVEIAPLVNPPSSLDLKIFEAHVHFTKTLKDEDLPPEFRGLQGTFECLACPQVIEKLKKLGCNAIQIMPIQAGTREWWLEQNAWNYWNDHFFGVKAQYLGAEEPHQRIRAIRETISKLHEAGIAVIVDGVFGHTSEGAHPDGSTVTNWGAKFKDDHHSVGPTHSFRGLNPVELTLRRHDGRPIDATGCGLSMRFDTPAGQLLLEQIVHAWYDVYGFDGIRYDQATIFGRENGSGEFNPKAKALQFLARAARERGKYAIAEASDMGEESWTEYPEVFPPFFTTQRLIGRNIGTAFFGGWDKFGYRGGEFPLQAMAHVVSGSRGAIHFTSCHDGRTLYDRIKGDPQPSDRDSESWGMLHGIRHHGQFTGVEEDQLIVATALALQASVCLTPGPWMMPQSTPGLHSNDGDKDPFTKPESVAFDWNPSGRGKVFSELLEGLTELRQSLDVFDTSKKFDGKGVLYYPHTEWFNPDGKPMNGDNWKDRFLGTVYHRTVGGLKGYLLNPAGKPAPVAVVRTARKADFQLPRVPEGWGWTRVLDTTASLDLDPSKPYTVAEIGSGEPERKFCDSIRGSGVKAYRLTRAADACLQGR